MQAAINIGICHTQVLVSDKVKISRLSVDGDAHDLMIQFKNDRNMKAAVESNRINKRKIVISIVPKPRPIESNVLMIWIKFL